MIIHDRNPSTFISFNYSYNEDHSFRLLNEGLIHFNKRSRHEYYSYKYYKMILYTFHSLKYNSIIHFSIFIEQNSEIESNITLSFKNKHLIYKTIHFDRNHTIWNQSMIFKNNDHYYLQHKNHQFQSVHSIFH